MKEYFKIGTEKWKMTVKISILMGFGIGLLTGVKILL